MTITASPARVEYTANAGQTIFNYTFKIFEDTDLNVYITPVGQVADDFTDITVAYTVTGLGDEDGGTVTLTTPTNADELVTIVSNIPSERTTDYQNNGDFRPDVVNGDFDRVVSIAKKIEDNSMRSLLIQQSQQGQKPLSLPNPEAGKILKWKEDLTGMVNVTVVDLEGSLIDADRLIFSFALLLEAVESENTTIIKDGAFLDIRERTFGNGGGEIWQCVLTSSVTPNTYDIVQCTGIPSLSLIIRPIKNIMLDSLVDDPLVDATGAVVAWLQHEQKNKLVLGDFLLSNIDESVDGFNVSGQGSLTSISGSATVIRITGDENTITDITVESNITQIGHSGLVTFVGNKNNVIYNTIKYTVFDTPIEGQQFGAVGVAVSGDDNVISQNFIDNCNVSAKDLGYRNVISFNHIIKACTGIELGNTSRYGKVLNNYVDLEYAAVFGGCDGVFGNRNHRYSLIEGNTILQAGEHGTYLQGDSFQVVNNTVRNCNRSGIKVGAKLDGNFWYPGETVKELAPAGGYTGFDVIIGYNKCSNNCILGGSNAEIYLQPNVMDVSIISNTLRDGGLDGIRTTFFGSGGDPTEVMKGINITGNIINTMLGESIACSSSAGALIQLNNVDGIISTYGLTSASGTEYKLTDNKCLSFSMSRVNNAVLEGNLAESVTVVGNVVTLIDGEFTAQENGDFNLRVRKIDGTTFTFAGDAHAEIQGVHKISDAVFNFPDATSSYPLDVDFNSTTPDNGYFRGNVVNAPSASRPLRIGGLNSTISDNTIINDGSDTNTVSVYSRNCSITGNTLTAGSLRFELGSAGNVVTGNRAKISDISTDGTNSIGTNYYSNVETGMTADPGQIQATATRVNAAVSEFIVVATPGDGVLLPDAITGMERTIINSSLNNIAMFPNVGDRLDAGAIDASVILPPGAVVTYTAMSSTSWVRISKIQDGASVNKVQPQVGAGVLSVSLPNDIKDSLTYTFPLASTLDADTFIDVEKSDSYRANTPLLLCTGIDEIEFSGGTDTDFSMNQPNSESYRFVTDGIDKWRL